MVQSTRHRTARMGSSTAAPASSKLLDRSGLSLVASAIGNIVRASKNEELGRERDQLVAVLRDWHEAFHRLEDRARALRIAYEKVAAQLERSERERQQWHMKFLACAKELDSLRVATSSSSRKERKR